MQTLAFYMLRAPISLQRVHYEPNTHQLLYQVKSGHNRYEPQILDPPEFIARVVIHIPEPGRHSVHYWGIYSCRGRLQSQKKVDLRRTLDVRS